jgi:hypothetical protein
MDELLEIGLIEPWGHKENGRPTLWVTTPRFLAQFGLASLRDLPGASNLLAAGGKGVHSGTSGPASQRQRAACNNLGVGVGSSETRSWWTSPGVFDRQEVRSCGFLYG